MPQVTFSKPSNEPADQEIPGKNLAEELAKQLMNQGCDVSTVDLHGDYGWSWTVKYGQTSYYVMLGGNYEGIPERWLIDVRPQYGVAAWLWKDRYTAAGRKMVEMLETILSSYSDVSELRQI